jgi:hypothetical protein
MLYAQVILNIRTHNPHHIGLCFVTLKAVVICDVNAIVAHILTGWEKQVV